MQRLFLAGLGIYALAALWKFEDEEDGTLIALSPFVAAIALVFLTRRSARRDALGQL